MARKNETPFERLKRKHRRLKIVFFLILILFAFFVYESYDYWAFKALIGGNYIYTNALDELYEESLGEDNFDAASTNKSYMKNFDNMVIAVVTGAIRAKNDDRYTYLYTPQQYESVKSIEKEDAQLASVTQLTDSTVMVNLPNISKGTRDFVYNNKKSLAGYDNIVLDLRHNYGGLLKDYYDIAELFLPKGSVIGREVTRLPFLTHNVKSKREPVFSFKRVVILQDERSASSAEGLIMALKENLDNVTTIGAKTFGKGIGQVTLPLRGGYAVKGTVLKLETPSGSSIHRVGIKPDIPYDGEDIVDLALETLRAAS